MSLNHLLDLNSVLLITLIGLSYALFNRVKSSLIDRVIFAILFAFSMFLLGFHVIANYLSGEGISYAVIYHLQTGLQGVPLREFSSVIVLAITIIILIIVLCVLALFNNKGRYARYGRCHIVVLLLIALSLYKNPAILDLYDYYYIQSFSQSDLASSEGEESDQIDDFDNYYQIPPISQKPKNKKNLVLIYAEGLERTYFDEQRFPDLITELKKIEKNAISFTNIQEVPGTSWTIAGFVSSQCGLPLFILSHDNTMTKINQFMPSAVCLSDVLNNSGFTTAYMGGAPLSFAGKRKFLETHGFDEMFGRFELLDQLENREYLNWWGLYDDTLLDMAYEKFLELSNNSSEQFGMAVLTLDTHPPSGYRSKSCQDIQYQNGQISMLNSIKCSDHLISKFVQKIQRSPFASNTVIVIASDHLTLPISNAHDLVKNVERTNLFMILDPSEMKGKKINVLGSTMDIGSTLLPFIGLDGTIGLGRNLLSDDYSAAETLYIHDNLDRWRPSIFRFWDFPPMKGSLFINTKDKFFTLGGTEYSLPAIIAWDNPNKPIIGFGYPISNPWLNIANKVSSFDKDKSYVLIEYCSELQLARKAIKKPSWLYQLDRIYDRKSWCLAYGVGDQLKYATVLPEEKEFDLKDIIQE